MKSTNLNYQTLVPLPKSSVKNLSPRVPTPTSLKYPGFLPSLPSPNSLESRPLRQVLRKESLAMISLDLSSTSHLRCLRRENSHMQVTYGLLVSSSSKCIAGNFHSKENAKTKLLNKFRKDNMKFQAAFQR